MLDGLARCVLVIILPTWQYQQQCLHQKKDFPAPQILIRSDKCMHDPISMIIILFWLHKGDSRVWQHMPEKKLWYPYKLEQVWEKLGMKLKSKIVIKKWRKWNIFNSVIFSLFIFFWPKFVPIWMGSDAFLGNFDEYV